MFDTGYKVVLSTGYKVAFGSGYKVVSKFHAATRKAKAGRRSQDNLQPHRFGGLSFQSM